LQGHQQLDQHKLLIIKTLGASLEIKKVDEKGSRGIVRGGRMPLPNQRR